MDKKIKEPVEQATPTTKALNWLFFKLYVVVPMKGRERPRLNVQNPFTYPILFIFIVLTWLVEIVRTAASVVFGGFYNVLAIYITTVRAGWEDNTVDELAREILSTKAQYEKYGTVGKAHDANGAPKPNHPNMRVNGSH